MIVGQTQTDASHVSVPQSMDGFLRSVEKSAYRIAYLATSHREEALDLVQDAMLKMVKCYSRRNPEEWKPLFYRILNNQITDGYRRQSIKNKVFAWFRGSGAEDEYDGDRIDRAVGDHRLQPQHGLQRDETLSQLDAAIHALPLRQQQAFLLRMWEGLDVKQTAIAMKCSEGSVKTHLSRAMTTLRTALKDHYEAS